MTQRFALRLATAASSLLCAASAFAHPGHGLSGPHWHATDAGVFVAMALAVGAAVWLGKK